MNKTLKILIIGFGSIAVLAAIGFGISTYNLNKANQEKVERAEYLKAWAIEANKRSASSRDAVVISYPKMNTYNNGKVVYGSYVEVYKHGNVWERSFCFDYISDNRIHDLGVSYCSIFLHNGAEDK